MKIKIQVEGTEAMRLPITIAEKRIFTLHLTKIPITNQLYVNQEGQVRN
jgi:hypothetical protein